MGRRESPLEARAVAWARWRGIITAKMTLCNGVPDRVFFVPGGRPIIGEFKARGLAPEPGSLQEWHLARLQECGYIACCWDTWDAFLETMKEWKDAKR
jgi:hypothetical protein